MCHMPLAVADLQLCDPSLNAREGEPPSESEKELSQSRMGAGSHQFGNIFPFAASGTADGKDQMQSQRQRVKKEKKVNC